MFAALSATTPAVAREAMEAARRHGTRISYDLNYRDSLWRANGGQARAREVNRALMPFVDVLFGNEEDFSAALGFELRGRRSGVRRAADRELPQDDRRRGGRFPEHPDRGHHAAHGTLGQRQRLGRDRLRTAARFYEVPQRDVEILDRVGGGDSFASGLIYGLLAGKDLHWALHCGVAHGALAMSTPGDTTMATLPEVLRAMDGPSARIER